MSFQNVNWLSVVVATIATFAIGSIWYSPVLFSKAWQAELKIDMKNVKKPSIPLIFGTTFVLQFIAALVLDLFIGPFGTWKSGLHVGLLVSIGWIATTFGINYLYSQKSFRLFLIDAGCYVVYFIIMGIILGAW